MEKLFLDLETKWMTAGRDKDINTAREILSDDFTLTSSLSNGELTDKEGWIEKLQHFHIKDFRFDKIYVRVYGNTSIVNSWYYQEATANGREWSGNFLLTDVWVNKNSEWKVVSRHSSWLQINN